MSFKSTGKELNCIMDRFCKIDADGDGKITNSELFKYFAEQKYSEDETDHMMRKTNVVNRKQTVGFHEFFFMVWPQTKKMRAG